MEFYWFETSDISRTHAKFGRHGDSGTSVCGLTIDHPLCSDDDESRRCHWCVKALDKAREHAAEVRRAATAAKACK